MFEKIDRSVTVEGNNHGNIITGDGNSIYLPPRTVPKILAGTAGLIGDIDFVGRKEELKKIEKLLNQDSTLLLINGIGGIGKSTLASYYLNQHKDKFDYYGFIEVGEDMKSSFASALLTSLNLQTEKIDDLFNEVMNKLQNLEGKKLLIIDDIKDITKQEDEIDTVITLKNSGFKILLTSREVKENIPQYFLDIMSLGDAKELFLKYYPTDEIDNVEKILEYLDYHTLFIEKTAQTLRNKSRLTPKDLKEKFESGEFSKINIKRKESFDKYLNELFNFERLDEEEILLLKQLSILPSIEIELENLEYIFQRKDEDFEELLNYLVEKGWLSSIDGDYKLHQIIKEYILEHHSPTFEDIHIIIDYFNKDDSTDPEYAVNNKKYIQYFNSISKIVDKYKDEEIFRFYNNMGHLYRHLGNFKASLNNFKKVELFIKKNYAQMNINLAAIYTNQALVYVEMEDYSKALSLHNKSIEIKEELLKEEDESDHINMLNISLATSYNNLAELYSQQGKTLDKAFKFYQKSLKIRKELLGEDNFATATSYRNLGQYFLKVEDCKEALSNFNKALEIREKILNQNHPYIAQSYSDLALGYSCLGEEHEDQSLEFFMKALEIEEEIWGETHIDTARTYYNIGHSFFVLKNKSEALKYTEKSLLIWRKFLPEKHSYIDEAKALIEIIEKYLK